MNTKQSGLATCGLCRGSDLDDGRSGRCLHRGAQSQSDVNFGKITCSRLDSRYVQMGHRRTFDIDGR